jgi:hypothetical protein
LRVSLGVLTESDASFVAVVCAELPETLLAHPAENTVKNPQIKTAANIFFFKCDITSEQGYAQFYLVF